MLYEKKNTYETKNCSLANTRVKIKNTQLNKFDIICRNPKDVMHPQSSRQFDTQVYDRLKALPLSFVYEHRYELN